MVRQRRQQERDRLRADIVDAAIRVFSHAGSGAQMRDIAEAADVAVGSLYAHFPDKDALLTEIFTTLTSRALDHIEPIAVGPGAVLDRLEAITRYRCSKWKDYAPYFMAFSEICSRVMSGHEPTDKRAKVMTGFIKRTRTLIRELLEEGVASGEIRSDVPPVAMVRAWDGIVMHNLVRPGELPAGDPGPVDDVVVALVRQALAAPARPAGASSKRRARASAKPAPARRKVSKPQRGSRR